MLDFSSIQVDEQRLSSTLFSQLTNQIDWGNCRTYGNYAGPLVRLVPSSFETAKQLSKQVLAVAKVVKHIMDNVPKYAEQLVKARDGYVEVAHAGLVVPLQQSYFDNDVVWFQRQFVLDKYSAILEPHPDSHAYFTIVDAFKPSFAGEMAEVYRLARKRVIGESGFAHLNDVYGLGSNVRLNGDKFSLQTVAKLDWTYQAYGAHVPLTMSAIQHARNELLLQRAQDSNQDDIYRLAKSREAFEAYWSRVKYAVSTKAESYTQARESWKSIPVLESGTKASRSWGIEVETVRADLVSRPAGWESVYDGSLESMSGDDYCSCECSDCEDGYHGDCDDGSETCREFVSPVLTHFNSDGLLKLSNGLDGVETNSSPGIHVHVGASDLTVMDVARLVRAYSIVSPFLDGISYRDTRSYCKDTSSSNVSYWMSAVRKAVRGTLTLPYGERRQLTVNDITAIATGQPDDRYHDLNLTALSKHGTVEFRLMGPHYNYEHLVRWAWFCREMVNVSRLDLPMSTWTKLRSIHDLIDTLRKYGSEMPSWDNDSNVEKLSNQLNNEIDFNIEQV